MMISDLKLAYKILFKKKLKLVIVKNNDILFYSKSRGINSLLKISKKNTCKGASSADKLIGSAAAWLMVYAEIKNVFAKIITANAVKIFKKHKINVNYEKKVPFILNRSKTNLCPNELHFIGINNKKEAFKKIRKMQEKI